MKYISVAEAAKRWGLTTRSVQIHCEKGNIPGVNLRGKAWQIPANAERPQRKPRTKGLPSSILEVLKREKRGGISGGLISAILLNIPGTPSSVATCFDGKPMADKGEAGKALGFRT